MKCLSVQQPWAWAIIHGPKRIENRSWPTRYRGPLLIHAGKSRKSLGDEDGLIPDLPPYDQLDYGMLIGIVTLKDCQPVEDTRRDPFAFGPICWLLGEPVPFVEPIVYNGKLGLFDVPDSLFEQSLHFAPVNERITDIVR